MGGLQLSRTGRDGHDGAARSVAAIITRSSRRNRTTAPFRERNSGIILVVGMLVYFANQQSLSEAARGTTSPLMEQSSRSERGLDLSAIELISSRCTEQTFAKGSEYDYNLQAVFVKLVEGINLDTEVWEDASDFYDNLDTVYGVAGCSDLTAKGCRLCLSHIVAHVDDWCPRHPFKMEVRLDKCFLRYDNYYINFPLKAYRRADASG